MFGAWVLFLLGGNGVDKQAGHRRQPFGAD
jgi:hypothetical protein